MRFPRWLLVLLLVAVLIFVAIGGFVWIKISMLKTELVAGLGHALRAEVQVTSLSLDLWKGELHAAGITLTNKRPEAPWDSGEISQAVVHFQLRDLLAPTTPISIEVDSWKLSLRSARESGTTDTPPEDAPDAAHTEKSKLQVTQLTAAHGEVQLDLASDRHLFLHGVAFESTDNGGGVWNTQLRADSIDAGSFVAGSSSVVLRSEAGKIEFSSLHLQCAGGGITGDGEVGLTGIHTAHATLNAVDVPAVMLVAVKWQMKLSGLASGRLTYQGDDHSAQATGQISLAHGKFNLLPFLGRMAGLVGLPDISGVELDQATSDFAWQDHVLHLSNIDVRKNDVTRIAGTVDIDASSQIDGHLKLGLPNSILARWPQLQTGVFNVPFEDYGWADVHLTGTPDHLHEDLSERVLAAGIQGGNGLINQGTQKAMDLLKGFMGQ